MKKEPEQCLANINRYLRPSPLKKLLLKVIPNFCLLCKDYSDDCLCSGCLASLKLNTQNNCDCCSIALTTKPTTDLTQKPTTQTTLINKVQKQCKLCGECIQNPPKFDSSICTLKYCYPSNALIHKFKYGNNEHLGRFLSALLIKDIQKNLDCFTNITQCIPQVLIPVPTHWKKRFSRKFNASLFIANEISNATKIPILKLFNKTQDTPAQHTLNKQERKKNLDRSFSINTKRINQLKIGDIKHVAIVDDVLTTGTTANVLANQLREVGIQKIEVWTIARTPKPPPLRPNGQMKSSSINERS